MKYFFSCDWGTSTFRLRLVDAKSVNVLSAIQTEYGIAAAFENWKLANRPENDRILFYQNYLLDQVKKIATSHNYALHDVPIVVSGMASSSIGMIELPYKELPFQCNGSDLTVHTIPGVEEDGANKIILISGVKSQTDVMRGEETILAGCEVSNNDSEQLLIFPGTHSKHILIKNGLVESINTYMTGELFDLLSNKSILSTSVTKNNHPEQNTGSPYFAEGVLKGAASNLLNSIFHVRTNQLFKKASPMENYQFLSGLLIGSELKGVAEKKLAAIALVCSEGLKRAYMDAIEILDPGNQLQYINADAALIAGQYNVIRQLGYIQ
jgi:2-dehydro-3-deoxygalactonokinase